MISAQRSIEVTGVCSGLLYTFLLIRGYEICWAFAILSAVLYLYLCFRKKIYAESLLQVFYIFTAIYGWIHWNSASGQIGSGLPWTLHATVILAGAGLFIISGFLLEKMTDAANPYVDSFTTVYSIFATLLMINLVPENWFYWIVIDAVSIYLYVKRRLFLTAGLFGVYTILAIEGAWKWMNW